MIQDDLKQFGTADLILFALMLLLALFVGIFYAIKDRRRNDAKTYYFGGKDMLPVPVGLSIAVTFISAFTVIGFPAETYGYGSILIWFTFVTIIPNFIACIYYIPLIHRLGLSSIYEYLELRYHRSVRLLESFIAIVKMVTYFGAAIYLPALALKAVTPMSLQWIIVVTSVVCILYTTLGGMKAVIWTDTLQTFIMLAGMFAVFIITLRDVGGLANVTEAINRGKRNTFLNFNGDMTKPYTIWGILVGQAFVWCDTMCVNQSVSQRYLSCKSVKQARIASLVSIVPSVVFFSLATTTGCVMYAFFENCDPLKSGKIDKSDQLLPYLVVHVFEKFPGLAGLFISAAFSGTLSTVSSGINAGGILILEDFIQAKWPTLSSFTKFVISKITVALLGLFSMAYALCIENLDTTIVQLGNIVSGALGGPLLAVFTMGVFLPWCNTKGVIVGQITSTVFMGWIGINALIYGRPPDKHTLLPSSTDNCSATSYLGLIEAVSFNSTWNSSLPTTAYASTPYVVEAVSARPAIQDTLFAVSHLYYSMLSFLVAIIVAVPVSFLTGANQPKNMDPKLFVPLVDNINLPKNIRDFFRFGVPSDEKKMAVELKDYVNGDCKETCIAIHASEDIVGEKILNPSVSLL